MLYYFKRSWVPSIFLGGRFLSPLCSSHSGLWSQWTSRKPFPSLLKPSQGFYSNYNGIFLVSHPLLPWTSLILHLASVFSCSCMWRFQTLKSQEAFHYWVKQTWVNQFKKKKVSFWLTVSMVAVHAHLTTVLDSWSHKCILIGILTDEAYSPDGSWSHVVLIAPLRACPQWLNFFLLGSIDQKFHHALRAWNWGPSL